MKTKDLDGWCLGRTQCTKTVPYFCLRRNICTRYPCHRVIDWIMIPKEFERFFCKLFTLFQVCILAVSLAPLARTNLLPNLPQNAKVSQNFQKLFQFCLLSTDLMATRRAIIQKTCVKVWSNLNMSCLKDQPAEEEKNCIISLK